MSIRSILFGLALATTATAAVAGPSGQHSAEATYHSGEAVSHAGTAVASGAATVAAVPIVAVGSTLAVTGSVLEELGTSTIDAGADLSLVGRPAQTINITVMPNAAPTLD